MTQKQLESIKAHGRQVLEIFPNATERDPVKLCKKLRRLENKAHSAAEGLCNIPDFQEEHDRISAEVAKTLYKLLVPRQVPILINSGDPRGYALKIDCDWIVQNFPGFLHQDWGRYGILAPEIGKDGA